VKNLRAILEKVTFLLCFGNSACTVIAAMPANFKPWILDIFTIYNLIFTGVAAGPTDRQLCGVRLRSTAEPGHLCGHQAIVSILSTLNLKRMYTVNVHLVSIKYKNPYWTYRNVP
jgi:hypothetical protein